jgi:hypothetical protein
VVARSEACIRPTPSFNARADANHGVTTTITSPTTSGYDTDSGGGASGVA